jgi:LCP family protein required for cell wall assembly
MQDVEFDQTIKDNPDLRPPEPENDVVINTLVLGVNEGLSDIMMVIRYNKENNKIAVISVPRDTKVKLPGIMEGKINAVLKQEDGAALVLKTVGGLLDIPIHHYVRIGLNGAERIVDTIGGVKINVPIPMHYEDPTQDLYIHINAGVQVLKGKDAVHFIRYRSGYADADLGRIKAQHEFVKAFVDKLTSPSILPKVFNILNTMSNHVKTNLEQTEIAKYAMEVKKVKLDNIMQYTVPGKGLKISGIDYFIHDQEKLDTMLEEVNTALEIGKELTVTAQEGSTKVQTAESNEDKTTMLGKKGIRVEVLNSTSKSGLASTIKAELEELGYTVVRIGDTKDLIFKESRLVNRSGNDEELTLLALDLGISIVDTDIDNSYDCDITIILGKDRL